MNNQQRKLVVGMLLAAAIVAHLWQIRYGWTSRYDPKKIAVAEWHNHDEPMSLAHEPYYFGIGIWSTGSQHDALWYGFFLPLGLLGAALFVHLGRPSADPSPGHAR